jgi:flagellar hook assembly protein FlgD
MAPSEARWAAPVRVTVHDAEGRWVATLLDGLLAAGRHTTSWNGCDTGGISLASGIYYARVATSERSETQRLILMR